MNTIKISYSIEGLKNIDSNAPEKLDAVIEYTLPDRSAVEGAGEGMKAALAQFLSHPAVGEMVKAFECAAVSVEATGVEKQSIPLGKQIKQMYRLAQAKLGV